MTLESKYSHFQTLLNEAEHPLVIAHQRPDGDTLGCLSALSCFLKERGCSHTLFCLDQAADKFSFLPLGSKLVTDQDTLRSIFFDLIIVLDSGSLSYAGIRDLIKQIKKDQTTLVNIDHHHDNTNYGGLNIVDEKASAAAEVLYNFFRHCGITISSKMAVGLLTGLVTDSGNFTNPATTANAIYAASCLLSAGAPYRLIVRKTYHNKSIRTLKAWGEMLSRLYLNDRWESAVTYITEQELQDWACSEEEVRGLASFLNVLSDVSFTMVLRQEKKLIKGSLRTRNSTIDVSAIAKLFGGGGHKKAAGFSLEGALENYSLPKTESLEASSSSAVTPIKQTSLHGR